MAADLQDCPACGAPLESAAAGGGLPCGFCGWAPPSGQFPAAGRRAESRFNAETAPLDDEPAELEPGSEPAMTDEPPAQQPAEASSPPAEQAETRAAPQDGPAHFRQLTRSADSQPSNDELLEQVPEELREVLAERMQAAEKSAPKTLREDTVESLKARGYQVTEDARGARLTGGGGRTSDLSPYDTVRLAAEQEGGVQPQGNLPICPECQAASPAGAERCQWCGAELPQED